MQNFYFSGVIHLCKYYFVLLCLLYFYMNKRVKIALISFVVLGITGVAIIKGKVIIDKLRKKRGLSEKGDWSANIFKLPDDFL